MLSEPEARELLHRAVSTVAVSGPPADELVRRGLRSRRRTHVTAVLGVAAAVGLVAVGSVVVSDIAGPADLPAATSTIATTNQAPSPSQGATTLPATRLVGMGPVAVTVPAQWGTNETRCGTPLEDTVVFEGNGVRSCFVSQRDVSSVHFGPISAWEPRSWEQRSTRTVDLGALTITRSGIGLHYEGPREPKYVFSVGVVTVPSADIAMWVMSTDQTVVRQILDSVQAVPDGYVAIPLSGLVEQADLEVVKKQVRRPGLSDGVLLSADPPLGSVVPRGSTVTVRVSTSSTQANADDQLIDYVHDLAAGSTTPPNNIDRPYLPVTLGLGDEVVRVENLSSLDRGASWLILRDHFNGYSGPFSARDYLATDPDTWAVTDEGQQFCPWGRADDLPGFEKDRRLTIEPSKLTDCTQWWAVDVYVDNSGRVNALSLNLVEP
jgi:hypothetical protein